MDEDLIVLGAPAEPLAAGGEASDATPSVIEGQTAEIETGAATPGEEGGESVTEPKPEPSKAEDEGGEDKPRRPSGIQRMQAKIARLEAELASTRSAAPAASEDRATLIEKEIGPAPKEEDFKDWSAFEDAKAEHRIRKALAEQRVTDREAAVSSRKAEEQDAQREAALEAFQERIDEAKAKLPDYDAVTASMTPDKFKPHMLELVVESEKGALLGYYFGKNPAELTKLNGMSEREAAKAVGRLEARLTLAKPKTATSAPAPAKQVSGAAAPSSPDAEIDAWLAKTYGR
ncbi:hypothetical protein [Methylorubrum extorquens]|uniref:Scaffolding protein n=1 Tax=Methylorubrum extorquens (strain CM4 / NCIMB 13688) TaxID=440085 RepID=B7KXS1_METC4|nr:hypothetical protein [Methylorubrum extorquens]ACK84673.1 hypothetical protein Mchl_3861 [Methylorubrum extorquens CM4]